MPLSELLYRLAKGKLESCQEKSLVSSTDISSVAENDFHELVWENGQIQSSKTRKILACNNLLSQNLQIRDNDTGDGTNSKTRKFPLLNEVQMLMPSAEMASKQDDDMVPWLSYQIDEPVQHDYDSELTPELSVVTGNSPPNHFSSFDGRSNRSGLVMDSMHNDLRLEQDNDTKFSSADGNGSTSTQSCPSLSQHQTSFPYFRSRVLGNNGDNIGNDTHLTGNDVCVATSGGGFPSIKVPKKQDLEPASTSSSLVNFSHFSRPAALVKANLYSIAMTANSGAGSMERTGIKDKFLITSDSNRAQYTLIDSCSGLRKQNRYRSHPVIMPPKVNAKQLEAKLLEEPAHIEQPEAVGQDDSKKDGNGCSNSAKGARNEFTDNERSAEPAVASSSVCSGNSVERNSDDPARNLNRKYLDHEESEGPSEDAEEESVAAKKGTSVRGGTGSKRRRAAEVHNLSERKRRDRINEKMRALQELIPNCNKVDKASMLDEAIEYLKALQLQVQIMSMGCGLYMPSMMIPQGVPHVHAPHMAHFSPLGVGIGMDMATGIPEMNGRSSTCSVLQVPPFHGAHFPWPLPSVPSAVHSLVGSNCQVFGVSGQGLPMPFQPPPMMPMSAGPLKRSTLGLNVCDMFGPTKNEDATVLSTGSKDLIQSLTMQPIQNKNANEKNQMVSKLC
ncbi:hypothetical protein K2173_027020 [Erythroxylum novogranatense]|uniref:BHLH domain-containing protein n=1 Tax=Erythroxylum novogranatense TaxID=1862640 RepID=A0AAV8U1Q6_9ROSI|nr:hypothetical protein K2173_027020 [Erythroxylum novogranatense]